MSLWVETAFYFLLMAVPGYIVLTVYVKALVSLGICGPFTKFILSNCLFVICACLLVAPMAFALHCREDWRVAFGTDYMYLGFFLVCYLLAVFPSWVRIMRRYRGELRAAGFFY